MWPVGVTFAFFMVYTFIISGIRLPGSTGHEASCLETEFSMFGKCRAFNLVIVDKHYSLICGTGSIVEAHVVASHWRRYCLQED